MLICCKSKQDGRSRAKHIHSRKLNGRLLSCLRRSRKCSCVLSCVCRCTGSEVKCGASGASVGHIRAVATCGTVGLVHLKLSAALPAAQGQGELLAAPVEAAGQGNGASPGSSGGAVRVIPVRPAWWSQDWGHEEDTAA